MQLEIAISEALRESREDGEIILAVCHDPIGCAEEDGDWGYCPKDAVGTLYAMGTARFHIHPDGKIVDLIRERDEALLREAVDNPDEVVIDDYGDVVEPRE